MAASVEGSSRSAAGWLAVFSNCGFGLAPACLCCLGRSVTPDELPVKWGLDRDSDSGPRGWGSGTLATEPTDRKDGFSGGGGHFGQAFRFRVSHAYSDHLGRLRLVRHQSRSRVMTPQITPRVQP